MNELPNLYFQVFPRENVVSALLAVYKHNVLQFQEGTMGAVNGMRPNGQVLFNIVPLLLLYCSRLCYKICRSSTETCDPPEAVEASIRFILGFHTK